MSSLTTPFVEKPPKPLPPTIARFYANGTPTAAQIEYENRMDAYLTRLVGGFIPLNATGLPTVDPHVLGQVWRSAGVLTVSAG